MPSSAVEDYLKAIFMVSEGSNRPVSLGQVGDRVGVTPGTVTSMMRHLAGEGLVHYKPRRGVSLTPSGRKVALRVLRRHRIIELFLVKIMQIDWTRVHEEAEVLEHAVSDRLLARMDEMLGHPVRDPHGDPIPSRSGELPEQFLIPLSECRPGSYRVVRVVHSDEPAFLEWLEKEGLRPGQTVLVCGKDEYAQTLTLVVDEQAAARALGTGAAARLMVAPMTPGESA